MENEKTKEFAEKLKSIADSGAELIRDELKKDGVELNDKQLEMIKGVIHLSSTVVMLLLSFSK